MREIKFRAWDNRRNKMLYPTEINFDYINDRVEVWYGVDIDEKIRTTQEFIMQYTGLKDKNGKEIYEGDIIAVNEYGWEEKENYEVKYCGENGYPAFELSGWYQGDCNGLSEISEGAEFQGEVIGNVHENPELLKI